MNLLRRAQSALQTILRDLERENHTEPAPWQQSSFVTLALLACYVAHQVVARSSEKLQMVHGDKVEFSFGACLACFCLTVARQHYFTAYDLRNASKNINTCKDAIDEVATDCKAELSRLTTIHPVSTAGIDKSVKPEQKLSSNPDDPSVGFAEDKAFPLEHRRLNTFAGITCIDFASVLGQLDPHRQFSFKKFKEQFNLIVDDLDLNKNEFHQIPDDFTMLRFLQSDDYDIDLALKRIAAMMEWRQKFGVDRFLENPDWKMINRYRRLRVRRIVGMDKSGSPLIVERLGDLIASEESFRGGLTIEQWIMCYSFDVSELMATFRECVERTGKYSHRMNYIGDLSGARLTGAFRLISVLKIMTKAVERNFPEIAGNIILVNAPSYAYSVWNMVKKFLDPKTAARISILVGPSPEILRKICGTAVLPVEFGGTNPYVVPRPVQKIDEKFEKEYPLK